jgi:hypothetical protein
MIGCSDSGGGGNKTSYHLTGYNGVGTDSVSGQVFFNSFSGNESLDFYSHFPWYVNLTFTVFDEDGWGIGGLSADDFTVTEDGVDVPKISSEMNARQRTGLPPDFSYTLKTVLFLDNSPSLEIGLDKIIESALVVVDNIDEKRQQEIAIVAYDQAGDFEVVQDFTDQTGLLNQALLERIQPSYGTTNFYGAVMDSLALWNDDPFPSTPSFVQGFLVVITDGNDTTNLNDVEDAIAARKDKQIITVGLGEIRDSTADDLKRLGNAGYYPVPEPVQDPDDKEGDKPADENLCEWMLVIQKQMLAYADGFYWLQYKTTKTSNDSNVNHAVTLSFPNNRNDGVDSMISGSFSSANLFSGEENVYFNASAANPSGITEKVLTIKPGQAAGSVTSDIRVLTYSLNSNNPSQYTWHSSNENVAIIEVDPSNSSKATVKVLTAGNTDIVVTDTANNSARSSLRVNVVLQLPSYEFLRYVVNSKSPWFVDSTFQVRKTESENNQWEWVTDLRREDFMVAEGSGATQTAVDPERAEVNLRKRDKIPSDYTYTLKTVLLIDNTPSITENLAYIKRAAKAFVTRAFVNDPWDDTDLDPLFAADKKTKQQEIAVFTFDENGDEFLVQDFTSDRVLLEEAIDSIPRGFGPTDFYGGMVEALNMWNNQHSPYIKSLEQGVLIAISDGWDSLPGFRSAEAVFAETGTRQVITVGVGNDLVSENNVADLIPFGNAGFYSVPDPGNINEVIVYPDDKQRYKDQSKKLHITDLEMTLIRIQHEIVDYANSFYWLNYKSYAEPASDCANLEDVEITIKDNGNTSVGYRVAGKVRTCEFFEGIDGAIYVNSTVTNPWGENGPINLVYDTFGFLGEPSYLLEAFTYYHENVPAYEWQSGNQSIVLIDVDEDSYAHSRANLVLPAFRPRGNSSTSINVIDRGNFNSFKQLQVNVQEILIPAPLLYYPFSGDADDMSGNEYHGKVVGATLTTDRFGKFDSAYSFDRGQYIAIQDMHYGSDMAAVSATIDELTVCAWVKTSASSDFRQHIVSFGRDQYWHLAINDSAAPNVGWQTKAEGSYSAQSAASDYVDGQWHFICGWYKSTRSGVDKKLYVDGILVRSENIHGGTPLGTGVTRYGFIGAGSLASTENGDVQRPFVIEGFRGSIDDVMIFDAALTDEQIDFIYNLGGLQN